jgi:4-amino-4-deoxy-L-arabinose transferase-like glycosyltransferase
MGSVIGLLYLTTRFNLIACFFAAVHNHHLQQGNSGFDDGQRFLLRSTGNVLAYLLSIVPLCILAIAAIRSSWHDLDRRVASALFLASALTVPIAGFSGLFYLETERIWIFLTPAFALAAGYEIARRSAREGRPFIQAMVLLVLAVSCTQEFFLMHYR